MKYMDIMTYNQEVAPAVPLWKRQTCACFRNAAIVADGSMGYRKPVQHDRFFDSGLNRSQVTLAFHEHVQHDRFFDSGLNPITISFMFDTGVQHDRFFDSGLNHNCRALGITVFSMTASLTAD